MLSFSGFYSLLISLAAYGAAVYFKLPTGIVMQKFNQLITTGMIVSLVLSVVLYVRARRGSNSKLAPGGNTGELLHCIHQLYRKMSLLTGTEETVQCTVYIP